MLLGISSFSKRGSFGSVSHLIKDSTRQKYDKINLICCINEIALDINRINHPKDVFMEFYILLHVHGCPSSILLIIFRSILMLVYLLALYLMLFPRSRLIIITIHMSVESVRATSVIGG